MEIETNEPFDTLSVESIPAQMRFIILDVLDELQEGESSRTKGIGMPPEKYVITQLTKLRDLLTDSYSKDLTLEELTRIRNRLNRKIATLKKASLCNCDSCPHCGGMMPIPSVLEDGATMICVYCGGKIKLD